MPNTYAWKELAEWLKLKCSTNEIAYFIKHFRNWWCLKPQLPHSYYFTTRILVVKFANKVLFLKEIQDSHFPRKVGYFGTHLRKFGEKGVNFDIQYFTMNKGVHLGWKVTVLPQTRWFILIWKVCFIMKKGWFWAEKSVFCHKIGGHFQTGEHGWVPLFPVSEGAWFETLHEADILTIFITL